MKSFPGLSLFLPLFYTQVRGKSDKNKGLSKLVNIFTYDNSSSTVDLIITFQQTWIILKCP